MLMRWLAVPVLMVAFTGLAQAAECPELLKGSLPKLRAKESIDLCQRFCHLHTHAASIWACNRATGRSRTGQLRAAASKLNRIATCQIKS